MNDTTLNIFQKIADHIDYYYWNPKPGHPPRWLNILILIISLYLWMFVWVPIKVWAVEPILLSSANGDKIYLKENTGEKSFGTGKTRMFTDWMRLEIKQKDYWCICRENFCPHHGVGIKPAKRTIQLNGIEQIVIINKKYCLVISKVVLSNTNGENVILNLSQKEVKNILQNFGPIENYINKKIMWLLIILLHLVFVYNARCRDF